MGNHDEVAGKLKPSRSESGEILTAEEKAKYAEQVKEFLKATTPVRALKPSRSENLDDSGVLETGSAEPHDACEAEQKRFKELQANGEVLHTEGGTVNDDSYVQTPYYDDLNAVDKIRHHSTGTGFIAAEISQLSFMIGEDGEKITRTNSKTNPACNEWQPSPPTDVPSESKVHRSDP